MKIKSFLGGYDKNFSYLIWCKDTRIAAIVDPAVKINPIIDFISKNNLILNKILITHTHNDHIFYLNDWIKLYPNINLFGYNLKLNKKVKIHNLFHNDIIVIGQELITTLYTPGHYDDSICFWNQKNNIIFTGDTMFVGRTGRTVSNRSNIDDLYDSIYQIILQLPKQTIVYPGHHYGFKKNISIEENIKNFDFFSCSTKLEFIEVMKKFEDNR
tara:strand:+ start:6972 stop:7613 length:642 start_codon:yes stop_codon:yes gene_type:complete